MNLYHIGIKCLVVNKNLFHNLGGGGFVPHLFFFVSIFIFSTILLNMKIIFYREEE